MYLCENNTKKPNTFRPKTEHTEAYPREGKVSILQILSGH